ncbi:hypothetical protein XM38_038300 [Halomicronema hongdechloris C2206]|uniref:DUF1400 domain-containing protein n=1 Tax=Halomicronema hongdechloris C2206 TaxID=1641165 RepID=A0A1Z3HRC5_9CYAN|nr:alpha/beta hydrolase [Halomicronema hongdechloris]ASC72870.1 hypothetical protein XM38_038300 [Halomicronema hongdechloris C2206]
MRQAMGRRFAGRVRWRNWLWRGLGCLVPMVFGLGTPVAAAERVIITYGILERSVQVQDLEHFAETGELSRQLQQYAKLLGLDDEQLQQIRQVLTESAEFGPVPVAQFLYTPQGKYLLKQVGQVVQTAARQPGFSAIRGGLILAAADQQRGLTALSFLHHFPTEAVRIDLLRGLAITGNLNETIQQARSAIALVRRLARQAAGDPSNNGTTPDSTEQLIALFSPAQPYGWRRQSFDTLSLPVDLYLPTARRLGETSLTNLPVLVISHGLGNDRNSFAYLAEHLAAYGFAVITLEHTGSNANQIFSLLEGRTGGIVEDEEFLQRPQDVSRVLDQLQQLARNDPQLRGRLDFDRVGVIGQSFGGYTALALAGAGLNYSAQAVGCQDPFLSFNLSLLLQCQAQPLAVANHLADDRVRAVFVMNPIGSSLFGPEGYGQIRVPTMIVASEVDTVAPALPEQIRPFTWLTTSRRYLLLMDSGTHFSVIAPVDGANEPVPIPAPVIGPNPALARAYMEVMTAAFFQAHLQGDEAARQRLQPAFAQQLGRQPLSLSLLTSLTEQQLHQAL